MFPWIQPFGCDAGRVHAREATVLNCVTTPVSFVMKYCPFSTTLKIPHPLRIYSLFLVKTIQLVLRIVAIEFDDVKGLHSAKELLPYFHWEELIVPSIHQVHSIVKLSCCDSFSIRYSYCCNREFWFAGSSLSKRTSVLNALSRTDCSITTSCPVLSFKDSCSSHISATAQ